MKRYKYKILIKTLLFLTVVLSLLAVFAGSPYKISIVPVSTDEVFNIEDRSVKVIGSNLLAEWIIKKRDDFNLFDIRTESEFNEYHIPFAVNIVDGNLKGINQEDAPITIIYDQSSIYNVDKIKRLVKNEKGQFYILKGGVEAWMSEILFPNLIDSKISKEVINRIYKTSTFFGGKPVTAKERIRKKYSREGC